MIPPAALSAIDTAGDAWLAHPGEGPLSAAVAAALADYDIKPAARCGPGPRATCPECGRDWAVTIAGLLRRHRNAMRRPCNGSGRLAATGRAHAETGLLRHGDVTTGRADHPAPRSTT